MSAPHRTLLVSTRIALALALSSTAACDKLTGGEDKTAEADKSTADADAEKKKAEEEEAKKKADEEAKKKAAEDEAKQKAADEEAKKKAAEDEAKKKAEEEAKKPLGLTDIKMKSMAGMFGGASGGTLQVNLTGVFNEKLNNSTFVHAKGVCKKDARLIADVGFVNATDYTKQLHQYNVGEKVDLQGQIFAQGVESAMSPCQIEFRLGSGSGGVSVPLKTVCWNGSEATEGACEPPVVAAAMSGAALPLEVAELTVKPDTGYGSTPGIAVSHILQINEVQDDSTRITVKSACTVDGTKFVDLQQPTLYAGPFKFESGESVVRPTRMYWNAAFGFKEPPKTCDLTFAMWKPKGTSYSEFQPTVLKRACYKDDKVTEGTCDPAAAVVPAAAAVTKDSLGLANVKVELAAPYGATPDTFNVKVQADVTIKTPVDQQSGVDAHVTCKIGSTARVEKTWVYGVELFYLDPGETTRVSGQAFSSEPLAGKPKSCEVQFTAGKRWGGPGETPIEIGRFCLKKDKIKPGKC